MTVSELVLWSELTDDVIAEAIVSQALEHKNMDFVKHMCCSFSAKNYCAVFRHFHVDGSQMDANTRTAWEYAKSIILPAARIALEKHISDKKRELMELDATQQ